MTLTNEEITKIAEASAQKVLEGLHRYAIEYREPESVEQGLLDSMVEEKTATDWYEKRAQHAVSFHADDKTAKLYRHIADEEKHHYSELSERLQQLVLEHKP